MHECSLQELSEMKKNVRKQKLLIIMKGKLLNEKRLNEVKANEWKWSDWMKGQRVNENEWMKRNGGLKWWTYNHELPKITKEWLKWIIIMLYNYKWFFNIIL